MPVKMGREGWASHPDSSAATNREINGDTPATPPPSLLQDTLPAPRAHLYPQATRGLVHRASLVLGGYPQCLPQGTPSANRVPRCHPLRTAPWCQPGSQVPPLRAGTPVARRPLQVLEPSLEARVEFWCTAHTGRRPGCSMSKQLHSPSTHGPNKTLGCGPHAGTAPPCPGHGYSAHLPHRAV